MAKPIAIQSSDTFLTWRTSFNTLLSQAPEVVESTSAPTVNDDITDYEIGTIWVHTTVPKAYVLVDNTDGAAVWHVIGVGSLSVGTTELQDNSVTDAKLRDSAALSIIGRAANSVGDPGDIVAGSDGHVLRRSGTTVGFGTIATSGITNNAVTVAKLQQVDTSTILGRATAGTGNVEVLTVTGGLEVHDGGVGGIVLRRSALTGDVAASAASNTTAIQPNVVSNAKLRDSAALSVIGRTENSVGDPADIVAGSDGHVLRRSGTTVGFGTLAASAFPAGIISNSLLANMAQATLKGRASGAGTGPPGDLSASQIRTIIDSAGNWNMGSNQITAGSFITANGNVDIVGTSTTERSVTARNTAGGARLLSSNAGLMAISQTTSAGSWEKHWITGARNANVDVCYNGTTKIRTNSDGATTFGHQVISDDAVVGGVTKHATGYTTAINVTDKSRYQATNSGGVTLIFSGLPSGDHSVIGASYQVEGTVVVKNGSSPGAVNITGIAPTEVIGQPDIITANAISVLSYIIQRTTGDAYTSVLIWSSP